MKLHTLNSKHSFVNLIADSIVNELNSKSIISVTLSDNYIIINGITSCLNVLSDYSIKNIINYCSNDIFNKIKDFTIVNTIKYNKKIDDDYQINNLNVYNTIRPIYNLNEPTSNPEKLQYTSEFPHGYSLDCGRLILYYCETIFKNIKNHIGLKSGVISVNDKIITFTGDCYLSNQKVESLILDYFDFNFMLFKEKLQGYDLKRDVLHPLETKPWLSDDMILKIDVI